MKMTIDEIIELLEKHKGGVGYWEVYLDGSGFPITPMWSCPEDQSLEKMLNAICRAGFAVRWVYPKLMVKRIMRYDEFPAIFWVQGPTDGDAQWNMAITINSEYIGMLHHKVKISSLTDNWKWSPDRNELKSFFVEE